jgi:hypothetical protein
LTMKVSSSTDRTNINKLKNMIIIIVGSKEKQKKKRKYNFRT